MNIIINIKLVSGKLYTLSIKMGNHLEVQLVHHFYPLTWKYVSVGNDVWVCDYRRGNSPQIKNPEIGGGGDPTQVPKPKIPLPPPPPPPPPFSTGGQAIMTLQSRSNLQSNKPSIFLVSRHASICPCSQLTG